VGSSFIPRDISWAEVGFGLAAAAAIVGYVAFILGPSWSSYGRLWEKFAAGFLSLFILAALLGVGVGVGFAVVYSYDTWAGP
jgi:hypothetical protein